MKLFSSPTKTLKAFHKKGTKPFFQSETNEILTLLQSLEKSELKAFYKASDKIVNHQFQCLHQPITLGPSGWVYQGEVFRQLNIQTLKRSEITYLQDHLIIGSALYGLTSLHTEIIDHRLDLTKNLKGLNLIDYWKPKVKAYFKDELIINLASQEYAQLIEGLNVINVIFLNDGKVKSTYAKQARGLFLRICAQQKIKDVKQIKSLNILDYTVNSKLSDDNLICFSK